MIFSSLKQVTAVITLGIRHCGSDEAVEPNRASFLLSFFFLPITLLEAIIGPPPADVGVSKYIWYCVDPCYITGAFTKGILQLEQRAGKDHCGCRVLKVKKVLLRNIVQPNLRRNMKRFTDGFIYIYIYKRKK